MAARYNAATVADILGISRARWELRNMARALSLMSWLNTADDETRRAAANWALRHWQAYAAECNRRRDIRFNRNRS